MKLPTPIEAPYLFYKKRKASFDASLQYKSVEAIYQAVIKYISVTFLLIAKDRNPETFSKAADLICNSSSLGGWIGAMRFVLSELKVSNGPDAAIDYMRYFQGFKDHPDKQKLQEFLLILNRLIIILNKQGYKFGATKNLDILGIFTKIVEIRNKCAHGVIQITKYIELIEDYELLLEELIWFLPLDKFTFYGQYNRSSLRLEGAIPVAEDKPNPAYFWVESNLLGCNFDSDIPFMQFHNDTQEVYFLNESVDDTTELSEFINYANGQIHYWKVPRTGFLADIYLEKPKIKTVKVNEECYETINNIGKQWIPLALKNSSLELLPKKGRMIYMFCVKPSVSGVESFDMLYVGKSENPIERFKAYLQIFKGYNKSRTEISAMFEKYSDRICFMYVLLKPKADLAKVESAFYEIFQPPYNMVAPPQND